MQAVLNAALPIFALILTGFLCARFRGLDRFCNGQSQPLRGLPCAAGSDVPGDVENHSGPSSAVWLCSDICGRDSSYVRNGLRIEPLRAGQSLIRASKVWTRATAMWVLWVYRFAF